MRCPLSDADEGGGGGGFTHPPPAPLFKGGGGAGGGGGGGGGGGVCTTLHRRHALKAVGWQWGGDRMASVVASGQATHGCVVNIAWPLVAFLVLLTLADPSPSRPKNTICKVILVYVRLVMDVGDLT